MFDRFGVFATSVSDYPDELDRDLAHESLGRRHAKGNDWRWQWAALTKMHYSECPLYAPLMHSPTAPEKPKPKILEIKPNFHGVSIDFNALWEWITARFRRSKPQ
jgi:hypothetical protein